MRPERIPSGRGYRLFVRGLKSQVLPWPLYKLLLLAGTAATVVGTYGLLLEPRWVKVERIAMSLPGIPPELEGMTLVQLSDLHMGPHMTLERVIQVVAMVNQLHPSLIVLTGDYVSDSAEYIPGVCEALSKLEAPQGVFAVLGNHDHWEGAEEVVDGLTQGGVKVLDNEHTLLSRNGTPFAVAGLQDLWEGQPDFSVALQGVDKDVPRIVLAHNPDVILLIGDERVDLLLAGHTHGGQVRIPFWGAPALPIDSGQEFAVGLATLPNGTRVYVNPGIGVIFPPVRFLCRPEITHMTLTKGDT